MEIRDQYKNTGPAENGGPAAADPAGGEGPGDGNANVNYQRQVLDTAMKAGCLLLGNGAEIFRVEETIQRICCHYGVESASTFVLSNGIFITAGSREEPYYSSVRHLPSWVTRLDKVTAVNQLSREIEEKGYSVEEVRRRLEKTEQLPGRPKAAQILVAGAACACFCFLFGGSVKDIIADFFTGLAVYAFVLMVCGHFSKITGNVLSGALIVLCCLFFYHCGIGEHLRPLVMGTILLLVPGLPFTNGIRDLADGDYISGAVRLLDAVLVFMSVGAGAGAVFLVYHHLLGGVLL